MHIGIKLVAFGLLASLSSASPVAERLVRRATLGDVATTGYATLNGGTTGGVGGQIVEVDTLEAYIAAVGDDDPRIVVITGPITASAQVLVGSNKSIIGKNQDAKLTGVGMYILRKSNVIVRNLIISKVLAANGDGIWIQESTNVWVDHCEIFNDQEHNKDFYDGLVDVTRASDWVTISHTYFHDHAKGSLVGHSDNNGAQDAGHLHVTYHNNHWKNVYSRGPSLRFGTGHIYNSYFDHMFECVRPRKGAQVLVESNYFVGASKPIFGTDGYAVARDNDYTDSTNHNTAPLGNLTTVPYQYSLLGSANVVNAVLGEAGATLTF
ncbi:uncharacterized protein DFL_003157 [Arthrobotrys flagrans]|uniref:pectate lyase n=1 Tax=Arthrobotrys flagrans TaxID=97331 RepID=A0A437A0U2_ARTFL|nr:hypothetical protein DFL_003157 [Arthrobotrys flagrans]